MKPGKHGDSSKKLKLTSMEDTRFLHCNIKTLNLLPNVMAAEKAEAMGCDECVFHRGDVVTECAHSNVSIIKDGVFKTHPTDHFILPGITRMHIIQICKDYEAHLEAAGQDCRAGQPTPGNKAGGLSTLDEKSLGCIRKGGTRPIVEVLEQAQRPTKHGAIVMDTAGYDISSVTSMVAGGCNAVIFTTGRGTPTGNAIVPVLKVTANAHTYQWMEDNMDVDLSPIITGDKTYQEMGRELLDVIGDVCSGKLTKAEAYGFSDVAVDHVCRFV